MTKNEVAQHLQALIERDADHAGDKYVTSQEDEALRLAVQWLSVEPETPK